MKKQAFKAIVILLAAIFAQGCATNIRKPASNPQPAKVKFSNFKDVSIKHVILDEKFAQSGANKKAAAKIDQLLIAEMKKLMPSIKSDKGSKKGSMLIEPRIEEIKFIGGMARFWLGAIAGSSAVLMKVTYTDTATGKVIAEPEFYRKASAFAGGMYGSADNKMLSEIVKDICNYTVMNR